MRKMICKCGNKIEITVPMYVNKEGDYICKDCFDKIAMSNDFIQTAEKYIEKLEIIMERNMFKRKINDQLDLMLDDFIELLKELRSTKKPLSKEKRDYFFSKLCERQKKIHEISKMVKKD